MMKKPVPRSRKWANDPGIGFTKAGVHPAGMLSRRVNPLLHYADFSRLHTAPDDTSGWPMVSIIALKDAAHA